MIELDSRDRWLLASLRSPERTSIGPWLVRESAVLIPCAVIFWFAAIYADAAALVLGPALYVVYRVYLSHQTLQRDRRLGEIVDSLEEERQKWAGIALLLDEAEIEEDADADTTGEEASDVPSDVPSEVAECLERAAEETESASGHYRRAAEYYRSGKVPRGSAHALAALGHLQDARREARIATAIHAAHSQVD